jgi:hypothetical protein
MLKALSTGLRFRLAMLLAVLAAACFVAPPAVMAFGHGEMTAHCLEMAATPQHGMAAPTGHMGHASGGDQHQKAPKEKQDAGCCGLFCLSALIAPLPSAFHQPPLLTHLRLRAPNFQWRAAEGLDRPPKSLLVV